MQNDRCEILGSPPPDICRRLGSTSGSPGCNRLSSLDYFEKPASDAFATARSLAATLDRLPLLDFGIGVSAGPVFAGNIGAESRYEYTVIGDAVNEAARLADVAKTIDSRILCSGAAIDGADAAEGQHRASRGSVVLRGRSDATAISALRDR